MKQFPTPWKLIPHLGKPEAENCATIVDANEHVVGHLNYFAKEAMENIVASVNEVHAS